MASESPSPIDRRFVADGSLVTRRIADEMILVPVSSRVGDLDSIYTLSEVGARIWLLLQTPASIEQIADVVCGEYEVTREVARADVAEFIESLVARKLARPAAE